MSAVRALARSATTIDTITWTALVAPIYGNKLTVTPRAAGGAVKLRTNDADSGTEFTVNAGIQKSYDIPVGYHHFGFLPGETVLYAQAVSGTGPVDVDWS